MLINFEVKIELSIILLLLLLFERLKEFLDVVSGKHGLAKNTHDFDDGSTNFKVMFNDCNETICDDCNVYLYSDCILGFSPKSFDLKMLFNPLEEYLDLPSIPIQECNVLGCKIKVVRVVCERSLKVGCIVNDPSNDDRIVLFVSLASKTDGLVSQHIVFPFKQILPSFNCIVRPKFLSYDEESSRLFNGKESGKVKVASIKHIAGKRLIRKPIHRVDIMDFCIGDSIEHRYLGDDINLSMNSDSRLCGSEFSPFEYRHAKVNGRGIHSIKPTMQLELFRNAFRLTNCHHIESKLLEDAMVSEKVGLRQQLSVDWPMTETEMFRLLTMCYCNICQFPKCSAARKLTKHKNLQVVPMRHRPTFGPVVVLGENAPELSLRKKLGYLSKNELPYMHICFGLESDAKVGVSKPGHGLEYVNLCA